MSDRINRKLKRIDLLLSWFPQREACTSRSKSRYFPIPERVGFGKPHDGEQNAAGAVRLGWFANVARKLRGDVCRPILRSVFNDDWYYGKHSTSRLKRR